MKQGNFSVFILNGKHCVKANRESMIRGKVLFFSLSNIKYITKSIYCNERTAITEEASLVLVVQVQAGYKFMGIALIGAAT